MGIKIILFFFLLLAILLQTTVISFPLFIIFSIILYILYPELDSVFIIFVGAVILDILQITPIGATALFVISFLLIINFAQKFFNTRDYKSILLIIFIASIAYALIFSYGVNWFLYILIFGGILIMTQIFNRRLVKKYNA